MVCRDSLEKTGESAENQAVAEKDAHTRSTVQSNETHCRFSGSRSGNRRSNIPGGPVSIYYDSRREISLMKLLKKIDENFEKVILSILVLAIVLVMLLQIVCRYFFNNSLIWSEEFCRYCYIYFMFIGTSLAVRERSELRVDAVVSILPEKARGVLNVIVDIAVFLMLVYLSYWSIPMVQSMYYQGGYSPALKLPVFIVYMSVPIGFILSALRYLQKFYQMFKTASNKKRNGGMN